MENNANIPPRPVLKKVKRPINRMPQQPPAMGGGQKSSFVSNTTTNPFVQDHSEQTQGKDYSSSRNEDGFNIDEYLDNQQLPTNSVAETKANDHLQFLQDEDLQEEYGDNTTNDAGLPPYLTKKVLILIGCVLFFLGIVTTKLFFTDSKVVRDGLQGVVVNPEVPKGRARCGVAERTQGCVLYIMNPQRQELNARDFYDLAAQMTGRQRFVIETGNMRYSNTKIRPGSIAQINIPPL